MSSSNHREEKAESESEKRTEVPSIADLTLRLAKEIAGGQQNNDSLNKSDSTQNAPSDLPIFYTPIPSDKYKCCACGEVLRRPVKFVACEHSCCSTCYSDIMSSTGRCPIDGNVLERSEVTVDKQMQRELDHLGVKCNYFEQGCSWTGLAVELPDHLEECQCRLVQCIYNCGVEFEVRFMEQHVTADCPRRPVVCQFCQEKIEMYNQPAHMEMCKRFPIPCPNGCRRKELPREELTAHLEAGCPLQVINCPFSEQGCQFRGRKRQIRAHLADELVLHILLLRDAVQGFHNLLDLQVQAVHESQAAVKKMQMKLQRCEAYFEPSFVWKIDGYREKFEEAQQGRKTSLFSNPFYSHRHGYRVCLSICPNGEQRYRGRYLSVFICICRGEYDALLSWPFSYPITLKLLDQNIDPGMRQDHVVTIRPNPIPSNNAYLKRPSSERNQCFGSPRFLELDQLHSRDFVVDNTLYIKAIFDINA
ncbi:TNF receptor associated factor 3 [Echinococcus multilocularis]|uniref:TNF receptor associated factor 3 n=1 Tax=Echinococcus multilocularis TaxID=6211 RepID=A0A068Y4Q1_ECHMU|nr:TNF receptor associated factor 3 [Echinococcus multilocularis]